MDSDLKNLRIDKSQRASRKSGRRWPLLVLAALLLVATPVAYFAYASRNAPANVKVLRVVIPEGAAMETDLVALNATGYVVAARKIEVASKVVGRVAWVGVERGDKVQAGQVIVRLEDEEYQARLAQQDGILAAARARLAELDAGSRPEEIAQSEAQLRQIEVEVENAEISVKRLRDLIKSASVARQELDDAEALLRSRKAQLDSARQRLNLVKAGPRKEEIDAQRAVVRQMEGGLKLARVELDNTIIRAPVAGTILQRNVEVGEFVTTGFVGDAGAKGFVVSLADLLDLEVELDISQRDFANIAMDQPAWVVTDAYRDRRYDGAVTLISPEANRAKATVEVRVKVRNPDAFLKPDMNATVSFLRPERLAATRAANQNPAAARPALRIPASAVREGDTVLVVENGKATLRTLQLGQRSGDNVEVVRGLIGGEDLILNPDTLAADAPVRIQP
jgi:HlyD family secretion protein